MNIDLDRLRQELDDRLAAAPQEPLITPALIQETIQTPRPRRRVWLVPASIAASVALVMGVGIALLWPETEEGVFLASTDGACPVPAAIVASSGETGQAPSVQEEVVVPPVLEDAPIITLECNSSNSCDYLYVAAAFDHLLNHNNA